MKVNRKEFSDAFQKVASLATGRTTLPILSRARLEAVDGRCVIWATDLNSYAKSSCACDGDDLKPICVRASALSGLLKGGGEVVELKVLENTKLHVAGNGKANLATMPAIDFPPPPLPGKSIGLNCQDLAECIKQVAWCTSERDLSRQLLACVGVITSSKSITASATTGTAIAYIDRATIAAASKFVLPQSEASILCAALEGEGCDFSLSDKYATASSDALTVSSRLYEAGEYFNVVKVFSQDRQAVGEIDRKELLEAVDMILMLADSSNIMQPFSTANMDFQSDRLEISYKANNEFEHVIEGSFTPYLKLFDPKKIRDALNSLDAPRVKIYRCAPGIIFEAGDALAMVAGLYGGDGEKEEK